MSLEQNIKSKDQNEQKTNAGKQVWVVWSLAMMLEAACNKVLQVA